MKRYLLLLSGLPGSGKSTYCQNFLHAHEPGSAIWHSRDEIRFQKLKDEDDYFSYEDEVYDLWIRAIQSSLSNNPQFKYVLADATHLSERSRNKTLSHLNIPEDVEVINIVFNVPLAVCMQRNSQRIGRARVPDKVIKRMNYAFCMPDNDYRTVIVFENGKELGHIE